MAQFCQKMKNGKSEFLPESRGAQGGREMSCFVMHFLCLQSKYFIETFVIYFGINFGFIIPKEAFGKDK